MESFVPRGVCN